MKLRLICWDARGEDSVQSAIVEVQEDDGGTRRIDVSRAVATQIFNEDGTLKSELNLAVVRGAIRQRLPPLQDVGRG